MKLFKSLLFLLLFVTVYSLFSKDDFTFRYNGNEIVYSSSFIYITVKSGYNEDTILNKLQSDFNFKIIESLINPVNSLTFNKKLITPLLQNSNINLNKIYHAEEPLLRTYLVNIENNINPMEFCRKLLKSTNVIQHAEPMELPKFQSYTPNDPKVSQQTFLGLINAFNAWGIEKGSSDIIIGISDSGVDQNHEDIKDNIAVNTNEIPNDNEDNDGNGYIDDFNGYNFAYSSDGVNPSVTLNLLSDHGHQVAGLAGAKSNNGIGITGVGLNSRIFPIKIVEGSSLKYAYKSILYAAERGLKVLNCSWGSPKKPSDIDQYIINYAISRDVAIVVSGGNVGSGDANTYSTFYPAAYDGVLGVGETNEQGQLTNESVLGIGTRLMAPGEGDYTVKPNNSYGVCSGGSSFSSPVVSGAVAIARAKHPELSAVQVLEFVRQCSDSIVDSKHKHYKLTPGLLNMLKIVNTNPMSIPGLKPKKFLYYTNDDIYTDRFSAGDQAKLNIFMKNFLGPAGKLKFVLSEAYDPANALSIIDSVYQIEKVDSNEEFLIKDFKMSILQNFADAVILRVDIFGENGYRDFFKFTFVPFKQISTFENNKISFSIADNGEFGFYTEDTTVGNGFALNEFGNQIYENSTIMVSENDKRIVFNDLEINRYDFKSVKKFVPPDNKTGIINDDNAGTNKIGLEIKQTVEFPSSNSKSARIQVELKNTSGTQLNDLSLGYFIDFDVAGEVDFNQVKLLEEAIPEGKAGKSAVEAAFYNDNYPYFAVGVTTDETNIEPQAAGLRYEYIRDFEPYERVAALNSGTYTQTTAVDDISTVVGMKFKGITEPNSIKKCFFCIAAGYDENDLISEMKECLSGTVSVKDSENSQFVIYPNPANNYVNVNNSNRDFPVGLKIIDELGNIVKIYHFYKINDINSMIDISDIPNGFYSVIIDYGKYYQTEKLIIYR